METHQPDLSMDVSESEDQAKGEHGSDKSSTMAHPSIGELHAMIPSKGFQPRDFCGALSASLNMHRIGSELKLVTLTLLGGTRISLGLRDADTIYPRSH